MFMYREHRTLHTYTATHTHTHAHTRTHARTHAHTHTYTHTHTHARTHARTHTHTHKHTHTDSIHTHLMRLTEKTVRHKSTNQFTARAPNRQRNQIRKWSRFVSCEPVWPSGIRLVSRGTSVRICLGSPFS